MLMTEDGNDSLIDQLKDYNKVAERVMAEPDPLRKEDAERFVIQKAGELVSESLEVIRVMREMVSTSPIATEVEAFAALIAATSSTLETLNKLIVTDKKSETVMKIKEMDINSRKMLMQQETAGQLLLTREEVFKKLFDRVGEKVIDAQVIGTTSQDCSGHI